PLNCSEGLPPEQVEYKLRRFVNDYLQPPKTRQKMEIGLKRFEEIKQDIKRISARNPHELMRAAEVSFIRDCAEMAARASLFREESRWGLYHYRADFPQKNNSDWFCHAHLKKDEHGNMVSFKKPIEPYVVPINQDEAVSYDRLRIQKDVALAD
ncbi:fumarate reductase/succinate dehydrogenase flavoprotein subunit, partial [Acinetobacter baumannii]